MVRIRFPPAESQDQTNASSDDLGRECGPDGGPMVRIHLPPADSPSRACIRYRASRSPAFRAGVRGWLGDRVGRDAQGVSISRQPARIRSKIGTAFGLT
jgi:hypothetical protein